MLISGCGRFVREEGDDINKKMSIYVAITKGIYNNRKFTLSHTIVRTSVIGIEIGAKGTGWNFPSGDTFSPASLAGRIASILKRPLTN